MSTIKDDRPFVVAIDPAYDRATSYALTYRQQHIYDKWDVYGGKDESGECKYRLKQFIGKQATRKNVYHFLENENVVLITGSGHGHRDSYKGYLGEDIFHAQDEKLRLLKGKIVHLLSCKSGLILGRVMVRGGVKAFWGYRSIFDFIFQSNLPIPHEWNKSLMSEILEDKISEVCFRMDIIILRGLLLRKTANEIYHSIIDYVSKVRSLNISTTARTALLDNFIHIACPEVTWGDSDYTIP